MELYINTAANSLIILELRQNKKVISRKEITALHNQAEKLLPAIVAMLKNNKKKLSDLKDILVETRGEGFTSLRIGVVTANTLAYALKIPLNTPKKGRVKLAKPEYSKPASITLKK
jgi:tRNA A37 threonylcarbamoyladenosine modification protein TsaB